MLLVSKPTGFRETTRLVFGKAVKSSNHGLRTWGDATSENRKTVTISRLKVSPPILDDAIVNSFVDDLRTAGLPE